MKKILFLFFLFFSLEALSQTLTISNVQIRRQGEFFTSVPSGGIIDFQNSSSMELRLRLSYSRPAGFVAHDLNWSLMAGNTLVTSNISNVSFCTPPVNSNDCNTTLVNTDVVFTLFASDFNVNGTLLLQATGTIVQNSPNTVTITSNSFPIRRNPRFNLQSNTNAVACGDATPITFTVQNLDNVTATYIWQIPAGWILPNGQPSPANFPLNSNSITLIPAVWPVTTVSATPQVLNLSLPTLTRSISFTPLSQLSVNSSITAPSSRCSGTFNVSLSNVPPNTTTNWIVSNTSLVSINSQTNNSITLNRIGSSSGLVFVQAIVSNTCGESFTLSRQIWIGIPNSQSITGSQNINPSSLNLIVPELQPSCSVVAFSLLFNQPANEILEMQWQKVTQGVMWHRDFQTDNTNTVVIYPNGNMNFEYRVRLRNLCGWSNWINLSHQITSCGFNFVPPAPGSSGNHVIISPVPSNGMSMNLSINGNSTWFQIIQGGGRNPGISPDPGSGPSIMTSATINLSLFNSFGTPIQPYQNMNFTIPGTLNFNPQLIPGVYFLVVSFNGQSDSIQFVVN